MASTKISPAAGFVGIAILGGTFIAYKRGMFRNMFARMQSATQAAEHFLKLRVLGYSSDNDGSLSMNIEILNPTSYSYQVQSILGDILVGGRVVGTVKFFGDTVIRPNDEMKLPINVRIMATAAALFRRKTTPVEFRGQINVNNKIVPLTMSYTI